MTTLSLSLAAAGRRSIRQVAACAIGAMLLASCGGDGGTDPSGDVLLTVTLRAPEGAAPGAVRFRLTGPGITGIQAAFPGYTVYSHTVSPTEAQVIVVGTLAAGPLITAEASGGSYDAEVLEVATTADVVVDALTGYNAVVGTAPLGN